MPGQVFIMEQLCTQSLICKILLSPCVVDKINVMVHILHYRFLNRVLLCYIHVSPDGAKVMGVHVPAYLGQ